MRFHLDLVPEAGGGRLTLRVEDSGAGFDPQVAPQPQPGGINLSGRGLALVRQLTESCTYSADGRSVSVEFSWSAAT